MRTTSFVGKSLALALLIAIIFFASQPVSAEVAVSAGTELITADELQRIVQLTVTKGELIDMGDAGAVSYLAFKNGDLRQYVTVEGVSKTAGTYMVRSVVLSQEMWTKKDDQDVINQWLISIQPHAIETFHVRIVESDDKILEATPLAAESKEALSIARAVLKTFLQP